MTQVQMVTIQEKDDDIRVDRWFSRYYPDLKNGQLQRLIRAKNIKVNGAKTAADARLHAGDILRVPPMDVSPKADLPRDLSDDDIKFMQGLVIHKDDDVIVLNKPSGLAVQGGSKTERHIDGMLDALRFEKTDRPKLVHRLDKGTSGVLVIARTGRAATRLAESFGTRDAQKLYWAVVVGTPKMGAGKIDAPLLKKSGPTGDGEQVMVDYDHGQKSKTLYHVVDSAAHKASWVEFMPLTGRTHQIRVHAAAVLETPIVGDEKYGGEKASSLGLSDDHTLHLHARGIRIPHPTQKGMLEIYAKIPHHMKNTFAFFGFDEKDENAGFGFFDRGRE